MFGMQLHILRISVNTTRAHTTIKMEFARLVRERARLAGKQPSLIFRKYLLVLVPIYFILQKQINANSNVVTAH